MRAAIALAAVLAGLLAGCGDEGSNTATGQDTVTIEAAETQSPTTEAAETDQATTEAGPAGDFEDDFSTAGEWPEVSGSWGRAFLHEGRYDIELKDGNDYAYIGPAVFGGAGEVVNPLAYSTQAVEVSTTAEQISVGLLCRWNGKVGRDTTKAYTFTIGRADKGTGWGIRSWDAPNPPKLLGGGPIELTLTDTNKIGVTCEGNRLTFVVNGTEVANLVDSTHMSGKNALVAARGDTVAGRARASFDNYKSTR